LQRISPSVSGLLRQPCPESSTRADRRRGRLPVALDHVVYKSVTPTMLFCSTTGFFSKLSLSQTPLRHIGNHGLPGRDPPHTHFVQQLGRACAHIEPARINLRPDHLIHGMLAKSSLASHINQHCLGCLYTDSVAHSSSLDPCDHLCSSSHLCQGQTAMYRLG